MSIGQFRGYQRSWLRGDVVAGLTVAAYLIPQVMAYATVAGLPPVAGLWAAIVPMAGYAVLGSSRQLSVGPESTTALMTAAALAPLAAGDPARYASLAVVLALLVGVVCFCAGVVRLGFLADLLCNPVLVGYMTGIALLMIAGQLASSPAPPSTGEVPRPDPLVRHHLRRGAVAHDGCWRWPRWRCCSCWPVCARAAGPADHGARRPACGRRGFVVGGQRNSAGRRHSRRVSALAACPHRPAADVAASRHSGDRHRAGGLLRQRTDRARRSQPGAASRSTPTPNCARSGSATSAPV